MAARYKRAMAPLGAEARARLWGSGGGSGMAGPASCGAAVELEELVHSFYSDETFRREAEDEREVERPAARLRRDLQAVLNDAAAADPVAESIRVKAEAVVRSRQLKSKEIVRRSLVRRMLEGGLDAGICESRWDTTAGIPAGTHEYVDVLVGGSRYIVEINLAGEFDIARPTTDYAELLGCLPIVFVGRPDTLEAVIELMCSAAQESIKIAGMHVPPWRRRKYMREKWFGEYRRRTDSSDPRGMAVYAGQRDCRTKSVRIKKDCGQLVKGTFLRGM